MNRKNLITLLAAAGATFAIVLSVSWPSILNADAKTAKPTAVKTEIREPTLAINGCELAILKRTKETPKNTVRIRAKNNTDKPVAFDARVTAFYRPSPFAAESRAMPAPNFGEPQSCPISLAAGETRVFSVKLGAGPVSPLANRVRLNPAAASAKTVNATETANLQQLVSAQPVSVQTQALTLKPVEPPAITHVVLQVGEKNIVGRGV